MSNGILYLGLLVLSMLLLIPIFLSSEVQTMLRGHSPVTGIQSSQPTEKRMEMKEHTELCNKLSQEMFQYLKHEYAIQTYLSVDVTSEFFPSILVYHLKYRIRIEDIGSTEDTELVFYVAVREPETKELTDILAIAKQQVDGLIRREMEAIK